RQRFGHVGRATGHAQLPRQLEPIADVVEAADDHGFRLRSRSATLATSSVGMSSSHFFAPSISLPSLSGGWHAESMISRPLCSSSLQASCERPSGSPYFFWLTART